MFEQIVSFIVKYKFVFLFYLAIVIFLFLKRKKLAFQAKVIILYRMKWGLRWMDKYAKKFRQWIILLGYVGTGIGFAGLVFISYVLCKNLYDLILKPATTPGVSLVLPGIKVPGLGVLPFWYWLIAIFIIAIVHEFSHGIVARAHNIKVKNTGIVLLGPIIGAFVEPNEKSLNKEKDIVQYSVLAAGSFSNILLAVFAIILLNVVCTPIQQAMITPAGFTFDSYFGESFPFEQAGIPLGTIITGINAETTLDFQGFSSQIGCLKPGDSVTIKTKDKDYPITLVESPDQPGKAFMGISEIRNELDIKEEYQGDLWQIFYPALDWVTHFLRWLFLLSLGIGLFNLLPLPIVDGGRMTQVFLHRLKGTKKGERYYRKVSMFLLLVLLLSLFYPLLSKLFV